MFCSKCGAQVDEGSSFCQKCGAAVSQPAVAQPQAPTPVNINVQPQAAQPVQAVAAQKNSGMAIASLVLSIIGLFFNPIFVCSILGIILGAVGIGQINRSNGALKGKGMAVAGIVIGIASFVLMIIIIVLYGFALTWF